MITDAIRDEKVLKFKVDYNDTRPQFQSLESEQDEKKLTAAETARHSCIPNASTISPNISCNISAKKRTA